jgi:adenylate cyclase
VNKGKAPPRERRASPRRKVDVPTEVTVNDQRLAATLVDISAAGALVAAPVSPAIGDKVEIIVPGIGPKAGSVIRVTPSSFALIFTDVAMQSEPGGVLDRIFEASLSEVDVAVLRKGLVANDESLARRVVDLLRRFSLLVEVVNKVSDSLSLDELLPRMIRLVTEALDAERATIFLHDAETGELFSRIAQGDGVTEIRIPAKAGIAGAVFGADRGEIIPDAYADHRFNPEIDRRSGFRTRNILCVPLRNRQHAVIGVTQVLNKRNDGFAAADRALLEAITAQAATALEHAQLFERLERARREEADLLEISEAISSDLQLETLLAKIVTATTKLLDAERSTLFIHDADANELWSQVAEGAEAKQIRIPANAGVAGTAFVGNRVLNIPDAYADRRFNPEVDRRTGYRTRNILCVPVHDRHGVSLGVVQVLNKRSGPFNALDEKRLKAFSAQIAIALQNAQLFADVMELKNYNESILKSLSDGVITLDEKMRIIKTNEATRRILRLQPDDKLEGTAEQVFGNSNPWILKSLNFVARTGGTDYRADTDLLYTDGSAPTSINLTVAPLFDIKSKAIGYIIVIEDITREKRVRTTMARYMAKEVMDKLLESGQEIMEGSTQIATVLFSDIRSFTTLAESLSARETVAMLNEYFTEMVNVIFNYGGILDKYIGDCIMAVFGAPITNPLDADNAVTVATEMMRALHRLNARRFAQKLGPIRIGIGMATGEVLAGSIGSVKRLEYTVIGDSVNLAARLEGASKYYGSAILMAGSTVQALKTPRRLRLVDLIRVKGREQPGEVHESLDHFDDETFPNLKKLLEAYEKGMRFYRARSWNEALGQFASALNVTATDGPSRIFADRCRYYRDHPPPDDWDGVWTMETK